MQEPNRKLLTTITPIFLKLMKYGIPDVEKKKIAIYTNNLAGIDEIQKPVNTKFFNLKEKNFNIVAGRLLKTYRAITGKVTEKFLRTNIWEEFGNTKNIIISVVTANWILGGSNFDEISLCARGTGHLDFKKELVNHSNYVFVIAPLTKIIKFDDVYRLNKIVPYKDLYDKFTIPIEKKASTFLLTSYRSSSGLSPLSMLSTRLKCIAKSKGNKNFTFCKDNPLYNPKGDKLCIRSLELPHPYIEDNFKDMYGYNISDIQ